MLKVFLCRDQKLGHAAESYHGARNPRHCMNNFVQLLHLVKGRNGGGGGVSTDCTCEDEKEKKGKNMQELKAYIELQEITLCPL